MQRILQPSRNQLSTRRGEVSHRVNWLLWGCFTLFAIGGALAVLGPDVRKWWRDDDELIPNRQESGAGKSGGGAGGGTGGGYDRPSTPTLPSGPATPL